MIIEAGAFANRVTIALVITIAAPLMLPGLLVRDWKKGQRW
ncbi:MAG TPA: hypothetical protein VFG91_13035 [Woeseiaceae bacterium]|nr:hypothetical protein [Woeseiaceae bacterium]